MQPRLWVAYATTALTVAAQFAIFSYLGALLEDVTGLSTGLVPLVLGLYGVGAFIGLTVGGRVADRAPFTLLLVGMAAFTAAATALAVTAHVAWVTIVLVVLLGAANFGVTPAVNARVFSILGETRTLGGAVNIAAFNVGIAVAPLASGLVINTGLGLAGTKREPRSPQPSPSWSTLPLPPDNCRQGQRRLSVIRWRDSPGPK